MGKDLAACNYYYIAVQMIYDLGHGRLVNSNSTHLLHIIYKGMLKLFQQRLLPYMELEIPDVQGRL